jgi:hypothetical protein
VNGGIRGQISDPLPWLFMRPDQTANGVEDNLELTVVSLLELPDALSEIFMFDDHPPQLDGCPHDFDVDRDSTPAPQNAGEHGHALFREGIRSAAPPAPQT